MFARPLQSIASTGSPASRPPGGVVKPAGADPIVRPVAAQRASIVRRETRYGTERAIGAVERAGHRVVAVLCFVDREEGGAERLARRPFCPLCRRQEIFERLPERRSEER
jgi:hypothetical protein